MGLFRYHAIIFWLLLAATPWAAQEPVFETVTPFVGGFLVETSNPTTQTLQLMAVNDAGTSLTGQRHRRGPGTFDVTIGGLDQEGGRYRLLMIVDDRAQLMIQKDGGTYWTTKSWTAALFGNEPSAARFMNIFDEEMNRAGVTEKSTMRRVIKEAVKRYFAGVDGERGAREIEELDRRRARRLLPGL